MFEHDYAVIMAGGGGTRLWPLSRQSRPKQMLSLFDERSLFKTAVDRLDGLFPPERILVVTVEDQARDLQAQEPRIPPANFLIEPMPRGTASVVGLAAVALRARDPQAVMAILTSDHFMRDESRFRELLRTACEVARDGYLVTLGVEPTFPATGYGYIQQGEKIGEYRGQEVYRVAKFREKPDERQAEAMLAGGDHSWNSGMFVWRVADILAEFERQMPALASALTAIAQADGESAAWDTPARRAAIERVWPGLATETIDYGIMEGARRVAVIPAAGLGWSDVGSWDSLYELLPADEYGNIVMGGEHVGLDTSQSLIYVNQPHRLIVTIGVEDLVLVDTGDVLLVCRKDQAQRVRQVVAHLKDEDQPYI